MSNILEVKNLSKHFGNLKAVNNLSFKLEKNSILGIAGPNGAGKTTLFNIITGIPFNATKGDIIFNEKSIQTFSSYKIAKMGLARTFQREAIFSSLSVFENVKLGYIYGQNFNKDEKVIASSAEDALKIVGIDKTIYNKKAFNLPLFTKKKLMLASALATNPQLLFLDEPASGLNHSEINETIELIRKINDNGVTIVVIEHILSLLVKLADKLLILNEGEKLIEDIPKKVMNDERVIKVYLGGGSKSAKRNLENR